MRFTLKKEERLYGYATLENVYVNGKHFSTDSIKIIFLEIPKSNFPTGRVVFSVPKKSFKRAVDRNLLKRRMREIYRNHKHLLYKELEEKEKNIHMYIIYLAKEILSFNELKENILKALKILVNKLN